jgi:C4-type Zn-finger protein
MPWFKIATCPVCGKRLKLKKENRLVTHGKNCSIGRLKCSGSNNSGKEITHVWKPKPA